MKATSPASTCCSVVAVNESEAAGSPLMSPDWERPTCTPSMAANERAAASGEASSDRSSWMRASSRELCAATRRLLFTVCHPAGKSNRNARSGW